MKCSVQLVSQCFSDVVASCVVCLLKFPASYKLLQLRTRKNYWNIFVASWWRQQPCLCQLRPRPLALKSRTRTRSRVWRSQLLRQVPLLLLLILAPIILLLRTSLIYYCGSDQDTGPISQCVWCPVSSFLFKMRQEKSFVRNFGRLIKIIKCVLSPIFRSVAFVEI